MDDINESIGLKLEQDYVKSTYDHIADDFSSTRYRKWPKVDAFLKSISKFSLVLDVGCGNGKYLDNESTFNIGCDASYNLLSICKSRGFEVVNCDMMKLPFKSSSFDTIICIAALHHIVKAQRRKLCIESMVNLLADENSRLLIQVWSYEQELERDNPYLNPNKLGDSSNPEEVEFYNELKISVHKNRTPFNNQDLLVPFKVKKNRPTSSSLKEGDNKDDCDKSRYLRYYHVFREKELEELIYQIPGVTIVESYYDKGNWCSLIKKDCLNESNS